MHKLWEKMNEMQTQNHEVMRYWTKEDTIRHVKMKLSTWFGFKKFQLGFTESFGMLMTSIYFGISTTILLSMFLIMDIFEHLLKPKEIHDESRELE